MTLGRVRMVIDDGIWHVADTLIELPGDDPRASIVRKLIQPGARLSIGYTPLEEDLDDDPTGTSIVRVRRARLDPVALLRAGEVAGHPGACIIRVVELEEPKKAAPAAEPITRWELVRRNGVLELR